MNHVELAVHYYTSLLVVPLLVVIIVGFVAIITTNNKDTNENTIQWKDGEVAYLYWDRCREVRKNAGEKCVTGYKDVELIVDKDAYCTLIFRCKEQLYQNNIGK